MKVFFFLKKLQKLQQVLTFAPINHCNECKAHAECELMTGVIDTGEMAEWSIAAVLKTVEGNTSGGSNPSLSAKKSCKSLTYRIFLFCISK